MHVEQVHVVGLQALQHLVDGLACLAFTILRRPELARNPEVLAGNTTLLDGLAHAALILIGMCCVDVAIAHAQGSEYARLCLLVGHLVGADAELRHP